MHQFTSHKGRAGSWAGPDEHSPLYWVREQGRLQDGGWGQPKSRPSGGFIMMKQVWGRARTSVALQTSIPQPHLGGEEGPGWSVLGSWAMNSGRLQWWCTVTASQGCEGCRTMAVLVSPYTSLTATEDRRSCVQFELKNCLFWFLSALFLACWQPNSLYPFHRERIPSYSFPLETPFEFIPKPAHFLVQTSQKKRYQRTKPAAFMRGKVKTGGEHGVEHSKPGWHRVPQPDPGSRKPQEIHQTRWQCSSAMSWTDKSLENIFLCSQLKTNQFVRKKTHPSVQLIA